MSKYLNKEKRKELKNVIELTVIQRRITGLTLPEFAEKIGEKTEDLITFEQGKNNNAILLAKYWGII